MTKFLQQKLSLSQGEEQERGRRSSLAAHPPGEDLNSVPEFREKSGGCDNQAPRDKKEALGGIDALRQSSHEIKPSSSFPCSLQGTIG